MFDDQLKGVLILVVVEDGLVQNVDKHLTNICSLNPCCSGRWSRTDNYCDDENYDTIVLILVVVEDGLVLMEKNLVFNDTLTGLNPCCSGRWSRTRPYKTLLIFNKLKSSTKQFFTFLNRKLTFS